MHTAMYVTPLLDELSKLFGMPKEDISSLVAASLLIFNGRLQYRAGTPADLVARISSKKESWSVRFASTDTENVWLV